MNILILGGGIAGTTAAEEVRKRLPEASITILEGEEHRLYSRVLLPHYLKGKVTRERVFLRAAEWYQAQRIELLTGVRGLHIDALNFFVAATDGREHPYDRLLIASGGEPNLFTQDLRGVSYLHSLDDADHLLELIRELLSKPKEEQRAVVYGGGFMACEYANIFAHYNISTAILMRETGFWSKILSWESQEVLRAHAEKVGVMVVPKVVPELIGNNELTGVAFDGREVKAGILGVGISSARDELLAATAGLSAAHGIEVQEDLSTKVKGIWAAGDVAMVNDTVVKRHVRYGNWLNAQVQGRVAGQNMAGDPAAFRLVSQYSTNLLGLNVVFLGDTNRRAAHEVRLARLEPGASEEHFIRDGRLVGVALIGEVSKRGTLVSRIGHIYEP